jgi:heme-degrading monooxygenase HmoA
MFAVIFEVKPKPDRWNDYLALAKQLRPKLEAIDGFIDNERFGAKNTDGLVLSLSIWRDEKSVVRWRAQGEHHGVQERGRFEVFEDYHLRVGEITTDSHPPCGMIETRQRLDDTETGAAKLCTITEVSPQQPRADAITEQLRLDPRAGGLLAHEVFESITNPGKLLVLASWRDATSWRPASFAGSGEIRHREVRVIRDYGMFDRREAPQFYPEVERRAPEPARAS